MSLSTARKAVTLTEVLIAIFLMGIGLMAILSLFPLGASQMAHALQDQRCAEAVTTADAYARVMWKQLCDTDEMAGDTGALRFVDMNVNNYKPNNPNSPYKNTPHETMTYPAPQCVQRWVMAMDDPTWNSPNAACTMSPDVSGMTIPGGGANPPPPLPVIGPSAYATASYPVLVDPIGYQANQLTTNQWWVGTTPASSLPQWRIPRRPLYCRMPSTTGSMATQWMSVGGMGMMNMAKQFTLMDDMTFVNGSPYVPSNAVERQGRYSWAYLFRRAHNSDRTAVEISTILYSGRSMEVPSQETTYPGKGVPASLAAAANANPKELLLSYGSGAKPAVRRGSWVLDATLWNYDASGKLTKADPQGIFYRVVNVDDSTSGVLALELQTPLLGGPIPPRTGNTFNRAIVVMDKVVEVFTKTDVARVAPQMPY